MNIIWSFNIDIFKTHIYYTFLRNGKVSKLRIKLITVDTSHQWDSGFIFENIILAYSVITQL